MKLEVVNISKIFETKEAVKNVSFAVNEGEFLSILGPSGCGKTTLLRMLIGLIKPTSGTILKDGIDITNTGCSSRKMGFVFQNYALFENMNVYKNVSYALRILRIKEPVLDDLGNQVYTVDKKSLKQKEKELRAVKKKLTSSTKGLEKDNSDELTNEVYDLSEKARMLEQEIADLQDNPSLPRFKKTHLPKKEIKETTDRVLETVGLTEFANKKPYSLSGGQQQRVAIARTLALNPEIILFDEPMSALDVATRLSLRKELKRIQKEFNTTMIYITHDQEEAFAMSDKILVMDTAVAVQLGTPEEILKNPANDYVQQFVIDNLRTKIDSLSKFINISNEEH